MDRMAGLVSSLLHYSNKYPGANISFGEIEHELQHIRRREQASSFIAVSSTALLILAVAGVLGGGMFILGALAAIALVGVLYTLAAREAESSLRSKQVHMHGAENWNKIEDVDLFDKNHGFLGLNWFSK